MSSSNWKNYMRRMFAFALLASLCFFVATPSHAVPIQITVQANLIRDPFAASHFGIVDAAVPIVLSFVVESDAATTFAAGTPIVPTGSGFNSNAHLFSATAIRDFAGSIGNVNYSSDQFVPTNFGTTGSTFDVLLMGDLVTNGISGVTFSLFDGLHSLNMSSILCGIGPTCSLTTFGWSEDFLTASVADITDIQASALVLVAPPVGVPEPATFTLLALALSGLALGRRRPDK